MHLHESTDLETLTKLHASVRLTLDYLCTHASLADLFLLQQHLSAQAAQVARQSQGPVPLWKSSTDLYESHRSWWLAREMQRQQSQALEPWRSWFDQHRQET
jgi:hypothetical protein